eukprot:1194745-Prorocentrum_minimum.AAC.3
MARGGGFVVRGGGFMARGGGFVARGGGFVARGGGFEPRDGENVVCPILATPVRPHFLDVLHRTGHLSPVAVRIGGVAPRAVRVEHRHEEEVGAVRIAGVVLALEQGCEKHRL